MTSIFISHGAPSVVLENNPTTKFFTELGQGPTKPKGIVVISAHWQTREHRITASLAPETIHDYGGFSAELYSLTYPAKGAPELAERLQKLIPSSELDAKRGLDHGAWNPLYLMYPQADIPVVQISLKIGEGAKHHYELGKALHGLTAENILVIGSGNLTHNLRAAFSGKYQEVPNWVTEFSEWVADKIAANKIDELLEWEQKAPFAHENHPTDEHFLPLFVALGAAAENHQAQRFNNVVDYSVLAMDGFVWE